ncbi:unnamed protein product [Hymenolepis diminuta]|uniref:Reverse transcriptase domain-containing protein n=1 Tax=Hymenolepis diminuta TaxID=6216 RepID=A0A0R3SQU7_HYMDI|nr:unnamed protein product [Hymenolepis diminuta]
MSEEIYTPSPQISQINPASLREFLPEHAPGFANIIQKLSSNPYDDLKAAILRHIQSSATERVGKLLQQECIGDLKPIALLNRMKLLAPGESFDTNFWKLLHCKKLSSYIQPILANAPKTERIELLAEMVDNIIETAGPPRIEEILHTSHLTTKNEPAATWEERMRKLEAKIGVLTLQRNQLRSRTFSRRRHSQSRHAKISRRHGSRGNNICWYYIRHGTSARHCLSPINFRLTQERASSAVVAETQRSLYFLLLPLIELSQDYPLILAAASGSPIKTYGQKSVTLDLGPRRTFRWIFIFADVSKPIIGADFLCRFELLLNLHLTNPVCRGKPVNHSLTHSITIHGNPVKARVRRLSPTRYQIAKEEFEHMLDLGSIRRPSSNWSSALHLTLKKFGDWRPCGDYCAINSITVPDNYPMPNIQDFSSNLRNRKIFSKIDLVRAYNQIPMAEADIPKTAIATPFGLFELLQMPFSLRNAAQTFQSFIDEILHGLDFVFAYIDYILVAKPEVTVTLSTDASQAAVGAVLKQRTGDAVRPLAFFFAKLTPTQTRYSTFGRELLAIYKAVKHFRYLLEGRQFTIFTDRKPLTYASRAFSDHYSSLEIRHLNYVLQFSNNIRHVKGSDIIVADCLSRTDVEAVTKGVDFPSISKAQNTDSELQEFRNHPNSLQLKGIPLHTTPGLITCDVSTGLPRPFVPKAFRRQIFESLHNLSHPGKRATAKLITNRFIRPSCRKDIANWTKTCHVCQRAKVDKYTKTPPRPY